MKKPYVGCMVMKIGGTLGTVIAINKFDNNFYNICWYGPDRVDITTGIHYTHVHGWMENLKHELNKNKSQ